MAIQTTTTTPQGFTVDEAYTRITIITATVERADINYITYKDQAARNSGLKPISRGGVTMPVTGGNCTFDAAYTHLKSLPEFAGAVDV
jgi:hypothetical protein